jgi:hypothetical protein
LPGVIVQILLREEYFSTLDDQEARERVERLGLSEALYLPPIRLTDLRLARDLDHKELTKKLDGLLVELEQPVTHRRVVDWKQRLSRLPPVVGESKQAELSDIYLTTEHPTETIVDDPRYDPEGVDLAAMYFSDRQKGLTAVSFAAAALVLFMATKMRVPKGQSNRAKKEAKPIQEVRFDQMWMAGQIGALCHKLKKSLVTIERTAEGLSKAVRPKPIGGSQSPADDMLALRMHRMGYDSKDIQLMFGIKQYDPDAKEPGKKGTGNPGGQVRKHIERGEVYEAERFPMAAALFASKQDPAVKLRALVAYRTYIMLSLEYEPARCEELDFEAWFAGPPPAAPIINTASSVEEPRDMRERLHDLQREITRMVNSGDFERGPADFLVSYGFERDHKHLAEDYDDLSAEQVMLS